MKTAEVAIEHVLTGVLALCAFLLPLLSGFNLPLAVLQQSEVLVGVLGLAYLFGVVFDKLADTVLSPIEQRLRLGLASDFLKNGGARYAPDPPESLGDPFPQDVLEFSLRGEKNSRTDWIDSLRSRIRTSRGLAVLGLPAMMGIAIFVAASQAAPESLQWHLQVPVILNLLFLFASVLLASQTDALKLKKTYELADDENERKNQKRQATKQMFVSCSFYALMMINSMITLAVIGASRSGLAPAVVIVVAGIVLASPLWAWYQITETHMSFVYRKLPELMAAETDAGAETSRS